MSVFKRVCGGLLIWACLSAQGMAGVELRFCYPQKENFIFYTEGKDPRGPGATVDHLLRILDSLDARVHFVPVRMPWKRCWEALSQGKVDLLVAGHNAERDRLGVFPKKAGKLDEAAQFNFAHLCLVRRRGERWGWDGIRFSNLTSLKLGIGAGMAGRASSPQVRLKHLSIWDGADPYALVRKRRVDAVLNLCKVKGVELPLSTFYSGTGLEMIRPAYIRAPVFLVASRNFATRHSGLLDSLWRAQVMSEDIYKKYILAFSTTETSTRLL